MLEKQCILLFVLISLDTARVASSFSDNISFISKMANQHVIPNAIVLGIISRTVFVYRKNYKT